MATVVGHNPVAASNIYDPGLSNDWNDGSWGDDIEEAFFDDVLPTNLQLNPAGGATPIRSVIDGQYHATFFADIDITSLVESGNVVGSTELLAAIKAAAVTPADAVAMTAWMFGIEVGTPTYIAMLGALDDTFDDVVNTISGTSNDDTLTGTEYADDISGGDGDDLIHGQGGDDTLNGGAGNDTLYGDAGDDTVDGGAGDDVVRGGDGADLLFGREGADTLAGNSGNDRLFGGGQNDRLFGGGGDDELHGGSNDDILSGGYGSDSLTGDSGADTFLFETTPGTDTVQDFEDGTDVIQYQGGAFADLTIVAAGGNVDITGANGGHMILLNTDLALVSVDDFVF